GIRDGHVTGVRTCALPIFLATSTEQLKEDQSVEPSGLVVRALVERLSTNGNGFVFRYVKLKDLKASIFAHSAIDLMPQQIAQLADRKSVVVGKEWSARWEG